MNSYSSTKFCAVWLVKVGKNCEVTLAAKAKGLIAIPILSVEVVCGGRPKSEWRRKRAPALTRVSLLLVNAMNESF